MHVIIHDLRLRPLLQFYDNNIIFSTIICSNNDKIYALRCLRYIVLDGNLNVIFNFIVINNIPHKLHGILPGSKFAILTSIQTFLADFVKNLRCNDVRLHIVDELSLVGVIDYHVVKIFVIICRASLAAGQITILSIIFVNKTSNRWTITFVEHFIIHVQRTITNKGIINE